MMQVKKVFLVIILWSFFSAAFPLQFLLFLLFLEQLTAAGLTKILKHGWLSFFGRYSFYSPLFSHALFIIRRWPGFLLVFLPLILFTNGSIKKWFIKNMLE